MTAEAFDWGEPIYVYSKADAVADGSQVEVPADIRTALNVKAPVYVTIALWHPHVQTDDPDVTSANAYRLVRAASDAFRAGDTSDMMRTNIVFDGVTVWGVIDGDGVTLMLPEDY